MSPPPKLISGSKLTFFGVPETFSYCGLCVCRRDRGFQREVQCVCCGALHAVNDIIRFQENGVSRIDFETVLRKKNYSKYVGG